MSCLPNLCSAYNKHSACENLNDGFSSIAPSPSVIGGSGMYSCIDKSKHIVRVCTLETTTKEKLGSNSYLKNVKNGFNLEVW